MIDSNRILLLLANKAISPFSLAINKFRIVIKKKGFF